jgi:hypothetical protein
MIRFSDLDLAESGLNLGRKSGTTGPLALLPPSLFTGRRSAPLSAPRGAHPSYSGYSCRDPPYSRGLMAQNNATLLLLLCAALAAVTLTDSPWDWRWLSGVEWVAAAAGCSKLAAVAGCTVAVVLSVRPDALGSALAYTITHHRWVLACFLMPVSCVFDAFWNLRVKFVFFMGSAPEMHDFRVADVQQQVRDWVDTHTPGEKMCTARAGWLAMSLRVGKYKSTYRNIRIDLRDVLEVDTDRGVVRVEPMVTMGQISATLDPLGWTLAVLPELDDLTVGGLVCGCGVESSSHRFGMFQEILVQCEIVMANGELVTCSAEQNPELFYAVPWSHGTLGFLVSAELRIILAKPWVRLEYHPCYSKADTLRYFTSASNDEHVDFVEGLVYSYDSAVVMVGTMVDEDEVQAGHINAIGRWFKPWWFTHVETFLGYDVSSANRPANERHCQETVTVPRAPACRKWNIATASTLSISHSATGTTGTRRYGGRMCHALPWLAGRLPRSVRSGCCSQWRFAQSIFWELTDIIPFGNHWLFRWLFGWAVPPKIALIKLTQTEEIRQLYEKYHVVQDMLVPLDALGNALDCMDQHFEVYPLWLWYIATASFQC